VERTIVAQHRADQAAALAGLTGAPVGPVHTTPAGTVIIALPGREIALSDVAAVAQARLAAAARDGCRLVATGRYGAFWWLAVEAGPGSRATVLGTHLRLGPTGGAADPAPARGLTPQSTRKEEPVPMIGRLLIGRPQIGRLS
jgi:hypothetical protein